MEKQMTVRPIKNTPFQVLHKENGKHVVIMGNEIVSEEFKSYEGARNYVSHKPWELISVVAIKMAEFFINHKNNK